MMCSRNSAVVSFSAVAASAAFSRDLGGDVQALAGMDDVADHQADRQRQRRHRQEVDQGEAADLADLGRLADRSDPQHDRAEDHRRDHHLDQADEAGAERLQLLGEVGEQQPDRDSEANRHDDRDVQVVGTVLLLGRPAGRPYVGGCGSIVVPLDIFVDDLDPWGPGCPSSCGRGCDPRLVSFIEFTLRCDNAAMATPVRPRGREDAGSVAAPDPAAAAAGRVIVVLSALALAYVDARPTSARQPADAALAVATTTADSPQLLRAVARRTRARSAAVGRADPARHRHDFVVVMSHRRGPLHPSRPGPDRRPLPRLDRGGATRREPRSSSSPGPWGPSVRAVVPVRNGSDIVALVAVGITTAAIERSLWPSLIAIAIAAALVSGRGRARRLGDQPPAQPSDPRSRRAAEITRMFEYYDAVLHAVREGLVLLDRSRTGPAGQRRGARAARPSRRPGRQPARRAGAAATPFVSALGDDTVIRTRSTWSGRGCSW